MRGSSSRLIRFIPALAVGAAALFVTVPGASASGTSTTFSLTAGSLTITQPASVNLGSAAVGSLTLSKSLGTVSVSDTRGNLTSTWTGTVSSTSFTTGGATQYETVATSSIAYSAGLATSSTGVGTFTPGTLATMTSPGTAGAWAGTGSNSVSWDPTVTFTLSPSQVAGTYTGTITHSVA